MTHLFIRPLADHFHLAQFVGVVLHPDHQLLYTRHTDDALDWITAQVCDANADLTRAEPLKSEAPVDVGHYTTIRAHQEHLSELQGGAVVVVYHAP